MLSATPSSLEWLWLNKLEEEAWLLASLRHPNIVRSSC